MKNGCNRYIPQVHREIEFIIMFVFEFLNEYAQIINIETESTAVIIEVYEA